MILPRCDEFTISEQVQSWNIVCGQRELKTKKNTSLINILIVETFLLNLLYNERLLIVERFLNIFSVREIWDNFERQSNMCSSAAHSTPY